MSEEDKKLLKNLAEYLGKSEEETMHMALKLLEVFKKSKLQEIIDEALKNEDK